MIYYLTTRGFDHTLFNHLAFRGRDLRPHVRRLHYDTLFRARRTPAGAYIFSDLERLSVEQTEAAGRVAERLQASPGVRVLNHPKRSMRRYELLRMLAVRGINHFNVYRLSELREPERYPVFLRRHDDHSGTAGELLYDREALTKAIERLEASGIFRDQWIICEFCDTADARGVYRKYSAFNLGGRIVPRHLFFARDWMLKAPTLMEPGLLEEERRYVAGNPHEVRLREIFRLARIDYGRIDYALFDGCIQVWEINTNPMITTARDGGGPERWPVHEQFSRDFASALLSLDQPGGGPAVALSAPEGFPYRCKRLLKSGWRWFMRASWLSYTRRGHEWERRPLNRLSRLWRRGISRR
ncbi:MAG: hypothetical protein U5P41_09180 [Gammaproteobacteria bacterium]|nr:hypothetical protein [Gammaproteobacteria bacterium]